MKVQTFFPCENSSSHGREEADARGWAQGGRTLQDERARSSILAWLPVKMVRTGDMRFYLSLCSRRMKVATRLGCCSRWPHMLRRKYYARALRHSRTSTTWFPCIRGPFARTVRAYGARRCARKLHWELAPLDRYHTASRHSLSSPDFSFAIRGFKVSRSSDTSQSSADFAIQIRFHSNSPSRKSKLTVVIVSSIIIIRHTEKTSETQKSFVWRASAKTFNKKKQCFHVCVCNFSIR